MSEDQQCIRCTVEKVMLDNSLIKGRSDYLEKNALFLKWGGPKPEKKKVK